MRTRLLSLSAFLLILLVPMAHAASFDCSQARRPLERAICSDPKLSAADSALGAAYRSDLARLNSSSIGKLRVEQVAWLAWVQQVCKADQVAETAPRTTIAAIAKCIAAPYRDRIRQMRNAISVRDGVIVLTRTVFLATPSDEASAEIPTVRFSGFDTLTVEWPEAQSTDANWTAWNRSIEAQTQAILRNPHAAPTTFQTHEWQPEAAAGGDADLATRILDLDDGRITTHTELVNWRGAHPSEQFFNVTWLFEQKRPMAANDVFRDGSNWAEIAAKSCWQQLQKSPGRQFLLQEVNGPDAKPLRGVMEDVSNWHVQEDGLHILYPEYAVAPRAAHPDDCVVPWGPLTPVLAAGFVAP